MRVKPQAALPNKRLIVFASADSAFPQMADARVDGIMMSYLKLRQAAGRKKWAEGRELLDAYPQYRYLDSGAFTFIRRGRDKLKDTMPSQKSTLAGRRDNTVSADEVKTHYKAFVAYLTEHKDEWDFVFDLDIHTMKIAYASGRVEPAFEIAESMREHLRGVIGDKMVPVWHWTVDEPPYPYLDTLLKRYRYIAVPAQEINLKRREGVRELIGVVDRAHAAGVKIHLLGSTDPRILKAAPVDTADSTAWIQAARFGYVEGSGVRLSSRDSRPNITKDGKVAWPSTRGRSKSLRAAESALRAGHDIDAALLTDAGRFVLSIRYYLRLQASLPDRPSVTTKSLL